MVLLTTTQAAHLLGVSPSTVIRWEHDGLIPPATRPGAGRHRRWRLDDIESVRRSHDDRQPRFRPAPPAAPPPGA